MSAVIDLFAGPGGWDVAASCLGIAPLGIEVDDRACATREAAGLRTLKADVSALDPQAVLHEVMDEDELDGLIASPPCQSFSMAGKRGGEQDTKHVIACAWAAARAYDERAHHRAQCEDERSMLVMEPVRWVQHLRPRWVALEQVPPVLGLWELFARMFGEYGYQTWTGILSAERYGVPQTRKRAILLASLDCQPHPPEPTHQAYVPGEPQRHEHSMFGEVLPWVSMAEALGWGMTERPGVTFAPGAGNGGAAYEGGSGARATIHRERDRGAWIVQTGNFTARDHRLQRGVPYERSTDAPAPVLDGKVSAWKVLPSYDRRQGSTKATGERVMAPLRPATAPAPTIAADGLAKGRDVWTHERPATTLTGSPGGLVFDSRGGGQDVPSSARGTVRVSIEEAATLQSFPAGYPWQGTKGQRYMQIGNAVPPLLALAVLRQVARVDEATTTGERAA